MTHSAPRKARFTGKHMTAILVCGFGVVVAVNFTMAALASSSFGGVVVENSYVASQEFNNWLDKAEASNALGYTVDAARNADGKIALTTSGVPVGAQVTATARHPLGHQPDRALVFVYGSDGKWTSTSALPEDRWTLRIAIDANGSEWRGERGLTRTGP
ncbi:FixH family protein [Croceicoccus bisphenolivorans]|uniref:FixH family protein n=1 Tax=Croceicoccus bisphenolivorans TaxID=1783232 RepID=UPI00082D52A8|nr:FixH family protein [Croceicoccus bisphenolivorans]